MRLLQRDTPGFGAHTAIDVMLVASGILLLLDLVTLPSIALLYSFSVAIIGLLLVGVPIGFIRRVGFIMLLTGTYFVFRIADIISFEYLHYGLASFFLLIGIMGIIWDATQKPMDDYLEGEESL